MLMEIDNQELPWLDQVIKNDYKKKQLEKQQKCIESILEQKTLSKRDISTTMERTRSLEISQNVPEKVEEQINNLEKRDSMTEIENLADKQSNHTTIDQHHPIRIFGYTLVIFGIVSFGTICVFVLQFLSVFVMDLLHRFREQEAGYLSLT